MSSGIGDCIWGSFRAIDYGPESAVSEYEGEGMGPEVVVAAIVI